MIDAQLASYATVRQLEILEAIEKHGSETKAAEALGLNPRTLQRSLRNLEARAASQGHSPDHDMTKTVPDGFKVRGVSSLYVDGKLSSQWVKSSADDARREEMVKAALSALAEEVKGLAPMETAPAHVGSDLLTIIPMGDPHFGMYSWAQETGADFDTELAERLTLSAVDRLLSVTPPSDTCVILPLGDIFHANDQSNQTPAHKHQLDVDTRFVRVLQVGIKAYRQAVLRARQRHGRGVVKFVAGNHDPQAVWALAFSIAAYFENDPRVHVDLSPSKFWFHRFGKVLLGATHGDTVKPDALEGVMAADRAQDWGETKHRYWYTGHIHSSNKKEFRGCTWESFRTLAAQDAYAAGHGYRAGRDMLAIVHHREHGEIERHRCDVGML
jgi:hypothetical protein